MFSVSIDDDSFVSVPCDLNGLCLLIVLPRLNGRSFLRTLDDDGDDTMSAFAPALVSSTHIELDRLNVSYIHSVSKASLKIIVSPRTLAGRHRRKA